MLVYAASKYVSTTLETLFMRIDVNFNEVGKRLAKKSCCTQEEQKIPNNTSISEKSANPLKLRIKMDLFFCVLLLTATMLLLLHYQC